MKNKEKLKKKLKMLYLIFTFSVAVLAFSGCGTDEAVTEGVKNAKSIPIKIEDIDWGVNEGIADGERTVLFGYTNNTKYTVAQLDIEFRQKDSLTADDLSVFDKYKKEYDKDDEEIAETYIYGSNRKFTEPGESAAEVPCTINGTYIPVESMAQYDIMQPDIATIYYIGKDDKLYGVYYDFKSQKYTWVSEEGTELYQWTDEEIANVIPKPEVRMVKCIADDDSLGFDSYGVTKDDFKKYTDACKEKGFIVNSSSGTTYYNAENSDGYELRIHYFEDESRLAVNLYSK